MGAVLVMFLGRALLQRVKFFIIFSSSTKTAELKQPCHQGCSMSVPFCRYSVLLTSYVITGYWLVGIFQIWSRLAGCEEFAEGFQPIRDGGML